MNKTELVDLTAEKARLSKADATRALDAIIDIIMGVKENDPVVLFKLGRFVVKKRAAREGRNLQTGEKMTIKATNVVVFKPSKAFKDAVKG